MLAFFVFGGDSSPRRGCEAKLTGMLLSFNRDFFKVPLSCVCLSCRSFWQANVIQIGACVHCQDIAPAALPRRLHRLPFRQRAQNTECCAESGLGLGFRVSVFGCLGFRVWGLGFRVESTRKAGELHEPCMPEKRMRAPSRGSACGHVSPTATVADCRMPGSCSGNTTSAIQSNLLIFEKPILTKFFGPRAFEPCGWGHWLCQRHDGGPSSAKVLLTFGFHSGLKNAIAGESGRSSAQAEPQISRRMPPSSRPTAPTWHSRLLPFSSKHLVR